jgi:hypothetical protein
MTFLELLTAAAGADIISPNFILEICSELTYVAGVKKARSSGDSFWYCSAGINSPVLGTEPRTAFL